MHLMAGYLPERIFLPREGDSDFNQPARYTPMSFHAHEYYEAFLLARGSCMHFIGSHTLSMSAGDLVSHSPGRKAYARTAHRQLYCLQYRAALQHRIADHVSFNTGGHLCRPFLHRYMPGPKQIDSADPLYHCSEHKKYLSVLWASARELPEGPETNPKLFFSDRTSLLELAFLRLEQRVTPESMY